MIYDLRQANGKKTYADVKRRIDKHLAPYFGGRRMTAISTADIRAYVTERQQTTEIVWSAHSVPGRTARAERCPSSGVLWLASPTGRSTGS